MGEHRVSLYACMHVVPRVAMHLTGTLGPSRQPFLTGPHGPSMPWAVHCRYDDPPIALNCGAMLRDCLRDEALAK